MSRADLDDFAGRGSGSARGVRQDRPVGHVNVALGVDGESLREEQLAGADHAPLSVRADLDDVSGGIPGRAGIEAVGLELDRVEAPGVVKAATVDHVEAALPNSQALAGQPIPEDL